MLLRSSSTPVLGSLLSSFTDGPSNNVSTIHPEACHAVLKHHLPPPPTTSPLQHHHHHKLSCTSSPISPSIERQSKGFRRVQSEGNLEDLAYTTSCINNNYYEDRFNYIIDPPPKRYNSGRQRCLTLETIPSFTLSKHTGLRQEEEDEDVESDFDFEDGEFEEEMRAMERKGYDLNTVVDSLTEQVRVKDRLCGEKEEVDSKEMMYLAKGLGVDVRVDDIGGCRGGGNGGGGGGGDYNSMGSGGNDGDNNNHGVEEYYKKMVEENPGNSLFLRNYAHFLYQCKEDRVGAEEYYSRAILADPKDGEVLSQYGKLVWEVHQDQERASSYFERAVQASPQDSHVHAAYAGFLWDTEEEEEGCNEQQCLPSHLGAMASTGV